ncbi:MAG TPA: glutamate racemase [Bacteroidales bacterium]|jgi:glutamate racemase|nr:glutamate racemase [Bacteroidales bacterium]HOU99326.1 glutamate racemase [Bacteroidales bacterium]
MMSEKGPIGVFDSGYGGLTVLKSIKKELPQFDYIYLGDNARAPYGSRSFEVILEYSLEAVKWFFKQGCPLVIFACNTASAKALRTIQQRYLPELDNTRRVLGVIRPTVEAIEKYTKTNRVGVLGTIGTIVSESYPIEIEKLFPHIKTYQQACPLWVPIVEHEEMNNAGADYFIQKDIQALLNQDNEIDTIILGCTHYPLLINTIRRFVPEHINLISQDHIVAASLADYLNRHPEIEERLNKNSEIRFFTTDNIDLFNKRAKIFFGDEVSAQRVIHLSE